MSLLEAELVVALPWLFDLCMLLFDLFRLLLTGEFKLDSVIFSGFARKPGSASSP